MSAIWPQRSAAGQAKLLPHTAADPVLCDFLHSGIFMLLVCHCLSYTTVSNLLTALCILCMHSHECVCVLCPPCWVELVCIMSPRLVQAQSWHKHARIQCLEAFSSAGLGWAVSQSWMTVCGAAGGGGSLPCLSRHDVHAGSQ